MTEGRGMPRSLIPGTVLEQQAYGKVKAIGRTGCREVSWQKNE